MAKVTKINSMRLLDANSIAYEVHHYDPQIRDAELVSLAVGLPADEVFKTLVVEQPTSKKPALVMLPCNCRLNLKRLAKALSEKKVALAPHEKRREINRSSSRRNQRAGINAEELGRLYRPAGISLLAYRRQRGSARYTTAP